MLLAPDDPLAVRTLAALRSGDVPDLRALLAGHPGLATTRFGDGRGSRTALHVATDWPGHLPRVAESVAVLVAAGADPGARLAGDSGETPLHWAASCDDVPAIDALVAAGADLEARGAVLTGGTALAVAVVFAQWRAAARLAAHGARATTWQAAALGLVRVVRQALDAGPPGRDELDAALWHAARGGHRPCVELLLAAGADQRRVLWEEASALDLAHAQARGLDDVREAGVAQLDAVTLHALLRLRAEVFVAEQDCVYVDPDGRDVEPATRHLWLTGPGGAPAAYLRVLEDGDALRIGRVATAAAGRGRGLAGRLVRRALAEADESGRVVVLDAQSHLEGWYERFGFTRSGDDFVEDGIPHTPMRRPAPPNEDRDDPARPPSPDGG